MKVHTNIGNYDKVEKIVPPTSKFPYWSLFFEDITKSAFLLMYQIQWFEIIDPDAKEEVEDNGTVSQYSVPDLLSEY